MVELDGDQAKVSLSGYYDSASAGYAAHWAPVLAGLAREFVEDLPLTGARAVLDLGAGTGSLLRHLAGRTRATLVGVDRSHGMLSLAPAEAIRAVMDAERLAFKDEAFDVALAMFMLFHLPNPASGLDEMRRVLRTGGTVAITTWGDDDPDFRAFDVFDEVLDHHGAVEGRGLFARHELCDTRDKCAGLLEGVGFDVVSVRGERMAHRWSIEDLIGFRTRVGFGRVRWDSLGPVARSAALEDGRRALAELSPEEMVLRDEVIYSVGTAA